MEAGKNSVSFPRAVQIKFAQSASKRKMIDVRVVMEISDSAGE